MNQTKRQRLRVPMVMAVAGSTIAAVTILHSGLWSAGLVEAFTAAATLVYYRLGERDTDAGALVGSRIDERQEGTGLRATALAGQALAAVAFGGFVLQTARGRDSSPFALLCVVGAIAFAVGIAVYGRS
jgi:hypothetical protein